LPIKLTEKGNPSDWELIMASKELALHVQINLYKSQKIKCTVKDALAQNICNAESIISHFWGLFLYNMLHE